MVFSKKRKIQEEIIYPAKLKEFAKSDIIKKCGHCSMCREVCPLYLILGTESSYPGGRLRVFRTYVEENYKIEKDFLRIMALCTTCRRCEQVCPISLNYVEILENIRKEIVSKIHQSYENQTDYALNTYKDKNPYGESLNKRASWLTEEIKSVEKSTYAYFVGCTSSYREIISAIHTAKILTKIIPEGIVLLGNSEYCCGSPLIRTGQVDFDLHKKDESKKNMVHFNLKDIITHNIEAFETKGVKNIIVNCAGCYKTISSDWPLFYQKELPFKVTHLTQFLADKVEKKEIKFKNWNKIITYHDPCHLGRHMGIFEDPRKILEAIPGIKLIEMKNNRENAACCGAGGGLKVAFPNESLKVAELRIKEAMETNADIIVTSCVFCKMNLTEAAQNLKSPLIVMNIEDIVMETLL